MGMLNASDLCNRNRQRTAATIHRQLAAAEQQLTGET